MWQSEVKNSFWKIEPRGSNGADTVTRISTVKPGFKNHQDKNLLDFKNQITNYQLVIYVVNYSQDKNILDFKNQNGSDKKCS